MPRSEPLELEPVPDDGIGAIWVGLTLWALAGVVLLLRRADLADQGIEWWLLTCLAGVLIGLVEWAIFAKRAANRRAREQASADAADTQSADDQSADTQPLDAQAADTDGGSADPAVRDRDVAGPTA
jgi:hypothetical protein